MALGPLGLSDQRLSGPLDGPRLSEQSQFRRGDGYAEDAGDSILALRWPAPASLFGGGFHAFIIVTKFGKIKPKTIDGLPNNIIIKTCGAGSLGNQAKG